MDQPRDPKPTKIPQHIPQDSSPGQRKCSVRGQVSQINALKYFRLHGKEEKGLKRQG
jgi:hypothetical protein